ncbi:glycosyltransferase [Pseudoclavibacter terrae]|uniref:Glycosyltransferase n=1 Tax=Pseudoclavibacter terrae TaxID=1530195 RepID=A0A7J5B4M5_9MICO|nr:glycosyltransferase [Pseudoclavibacter terrae]KAB1639118.1 glycosyltransferase [Pseudoclavibacter terrae]
MKICLVAAPLSGRSGVYRSTRDLVSEARSRGLEWTGLIGLRSSAPDANEPTPEGIREWTFDARGQKGVTALREYLSAAPEVVEADVVITLIPQSDVAFARASRSPNQMWVSFVRGAPWPAPGEQGRLKTSAQKLAVTRAMRRADDVWATTEVLANSFSSVRKAFLIPAGVPLKIPKRFTVPSPSGDIIWAGRLDTDKDPQLFLDLMEDSGLQGKMFGAGPHQDRVSNALPSNVSLQGWVHPDQLWENAAAFLGTSTREAFGRSAVEAAVEGIPVVLHEEYGCAPLLYTDPELRKKFVLRTREPGAWRAAMLTVVKDPHMWARVSEHVRENANNLSIEKSVDSVLARVESQRSR